MKSNHYISADDLVGKTFNFHGVYCNMFKLSNNQGAELILEAVEDQNDGYRSMMDGLRIVGPAENVGPLRDAGVLAKVKMTSYTDVYYLNDVENSQCWLEFGTENATDYYPNFVFRYIVHTNDEKLKSFLSGCE